MRCGKFPECNLHLEGDFEEILRQGYGYCQRGHKTELKGCTKNDDRCECGSRVTGGAGHDWYCPEFWRTWGRS
jgi:hypothetical protein